jgi:hypothetical protein
MSEGLHTSLPGRMIAVDPATYHADLLGDQPTLSASIAKVIVSASPLHAWTKHPRLNPNFVRDEDPKFDLGNVCHAVILEGVDPLNVVEVCEFDSWRSGAAKQAAAAARAAGKIPLLGGHYFDVLQMVDAVRVQLADHEATPPLFTAGKPEQTITWTEDGVQCHARLDWLHDDLSAYDDLKTTSRSANPEAYSRALFGVGGDVQAAMYLRGIKAVTGAEPEFRWVVAETTPPFAVSVISPSPDVLALGDSKVKYALQVWKRCIEEDRWPGYPTAVCYAEAPAYEDARWLEKTAREGVPV